MSWLMAAAVLAGCSGTISSTDAEDTAASESSSSAARDGNGSGSAGSGGGGEGDEPSGSDATACDGSEEIPAARDMLRITKTQYTNAIRDIFDGNVPASQAFPASVGESETGFSTEAVVNAPSEQKVEQILTAAEEVALSTYDALPALLPCAADSPDDACVDTFIDRYARRAFRREPTDAERADLKAAFQGGIDDGATFSESIALLANLMLQMPQFLYVIEDAAPESRPLSGTEMASRLSLMLWDSIPDEELLTAAENDELATAEQVAAQAERMLASPKADAAIVRFFREWTGTEEITTADKDPDTYPYFTTEYARSLNESFDRFVVGIVRDGGTLEDLLLSPSAHVDANMADFFGVEAPADGWEEVSLDPERYTGIITQPALLASLAHTIDTSYVYRGAFLRKRLMCTPIGAPPANAASQFSEIELPEDPTGKEKSDAVRARQPCGGCHSLMDPLGLALEPFDGLGHYREAYSSGREIDPGGSVALESGESLEFSDHVEMMEALSTDPAVEECFATQVFRFAMSRQNTSADACAVGHVMDALRASGGDIAAALVSITTSDAFRYRTDDE